MLWDSTQWCGIPPNPFRVYLRKCFMVRSSACEVWTVISETEFVTVLWSFKHRLLIWSAFVALCCTLNWICLLSRDFYVTGLWPMMWKSECSCSYSQYIRNMEVMVWLHACDCMHVRVWWLIWVLPLRPFTIIALMFWLGMFKLLTCLVTMLVVRPWCRFVRWSKLWSIVWSIPWTRCCLSFDVRHSW